MIWYIIITLFILFLTWILLGPVMLCMNTDRNIYYVTLPGIIRLSILLEDKLFLIRGWIFFIPFRYDPFRERKYSRKKKERPAKKRRISLKWFRNTGRFSSIIHAIRIRRLELDIDTDDVIKNAWLVPVFSAINVNRNIDLKVNFEGNLFLQLDVRTRIGAILWILLTRR